MLCRKVGPRCCPRTRENPARQRRAGVRPDGGPTIFAGAVRSSAAKPAEISNRSNSCSGTRPSRPPSAISGPSRKSRSPSTMRLVYSVNSSGKVVCGDCAEPHPRLFMVQDDLWVWSIRGPELLCSPCAERRLGRLFTKADFQAVPVNDWVFEMLEARNATEQESRSV